MITRDPKRIKPFLKKIKKYWEKYPDFRFEQLVNIISQSADQSKIKDSFYMEDDEFLKHMDLLFKKRKKNGHKENIG